MLIPQAIVTQQAFGLQLDYAEITSLVTVSATTEASPNDVVVGNAVTYDGATRICVAFYTAKLERGSTGNTYLNLWLDGATDLGRLAQSAGSSGTGGHPAFAERFLTPTAGTHTYSVRAWRDTANGFVNAQSPYMPSFIRITRA